MFVIVGNNDTSLLIYYKLSGKHFVMTNEYLVLFFIDHTHTHLFLYTYTKGASLIKWQYGAKLPVPQYCDSKA